MATLPQHAGLRRIRDLSVALATVLAAVSWCGASVIAEKIVTPSYVAVRLKPDGWQFSLLYAGALTPAAHFRTCGPVVMNCLYFNTVTGGVVGAVRQASTSVADDRERFGTGFVWDDRGWQLVPPADVGSYANGFQAGPTLLHLGRVVADSQAENLHLDPGRRARRIGIGRMKDGYTLLVATRGLYTLEGFAGLMSQLGAYEAVNMDGGTSAFMFVEGTECIRAGRSVPAALVVETTELDPKRTAVAPTNVSLQSDAPDAGQTLDALDPPANPLALGRLIPAQLIVVFSVVISLIVGIIFLKDRVRGMGWFVLLFVVLPLVWLCWPSVTGPVTGIVTVGEQQPYQPPVGTGLPGRRNAPVLPAIDARAKQMAPSPSETALSFFEVPAKGMRAQTRSCSSRLALERITSDPDVEMVVSPGLYDTETGNAVRSVGYCWAISRDGFTVTKRKGIPRSASAGGFGPAYVVDGEIAPDPGKQGFTSRGGQLGRQRRIAIIAEESGQLLIAVSRDAVSPDEFAQSLMARPNIRQAVGLSGGKHLALYVNGTWYAKPREELPRVLVFSSHR